MTEPVVTVSGDAEGGFIVDVHDGDRYLSMGVMAADEEAARAEGLRRFQEAPSVVDEGPSPGSV